MKKKKKLVVLLLMVMVMSSLCVSHSYAAKQTASKKATVRLNRSSAAMKVKETIQLRASAPGKVVWKSSNSSIASVSKNGKVKAKKPGTAVITAKYKGSTKKCRITVKEAKKISFEKYLEKAYVYKKNSNNPRQQNYYAVSIYDTGHVSVEIYKSSAKVYVHDYFSFQLDHNRTKYTATGSVSRKKCEISIVPHGKKIRLKAVCKDKRYNTGTVDLKYDPTYNM